MKNLLTTPNMVGAHLVGWRHPDAYARPVMNLQYNIETAQLAEQASSVTSVNVVEIAAGFEVATAQAALGGI